MIRIYYIMLTTWIISGCTSKIEVNSSHSPKGATVEFTQPIIEDIFYENGQIKIVGKSLSSVKSLKLVGENLNADLVVRETKLTDNNSDDLILAEASQLVLLALNQIFSLIVTDAQGAELSYDVTFSLENGSITASMFSDMGASDGDILIYNAAAKVWQTKPLNGLSFQGTWDVSIGSAPVDYTPLAGEYWVVSKDGSFDLSGTTSWKKGDWAIFNGNDWQQIKNSNDVVSFNGRQGAIVAETNDYTWSQIDKTSSFIKDIADVEADSPSNGNVLKWDGNKWVASPDATGDAANSVDSSKIVDGSIVDADVGSLSTSKITGLDTELAKITTNAGNISTNTSNISTNTSNISSNATAISGKQGQSGNLDKLSATSVVNDGYLKVNGAGTAFVFQTIANLKTGLGLAKGDVGLGDVDNVKQMPMTYLDASTSLGVSDVKVPSQNAVKSYVDSAVSGFGSGDFKADGTVAMTSNIDVGANAIKLKDGDTNYISLKSPAAVASDLNFVLPNTAGSSGQILRTDGAGNLSWVNDANSGVTNDSVTSASIANGEIVNEDIATGASIAQSKIANLTTDLAAKQNTLTNPVTGTGTDNMVALWNGTSGVDASSIDATELSYLSGVSSGIQSQLNGKLNVSGGNITVTGKTTTDSLQVNWNVVTSSTTAVSGKRYLLDTSSGVITLTLPASPSAGDIVKIVDFGGTFESFNLTIGRNSEKIMGLDEDMTVDVDNASFGLVYTSAANGWRIN